MHERRVVLQILVLTKPTRGVAQLLSLLRAVSPSAHSLVFVTVGRLVCSLTMCVVMCVATIAVHQAFRIRKTADSLREQPFEFERLMRIIVQIDEAADASGLFD